MTARYKLVPKLDYVVFYGVDPDEGIIALTEVGKDKEKKAIIESVGPDVKNLRVGDWIIVQPDSRQDDVVAQVTKTGERRWLARERDVIATVEPKTAEELKLIVTVTSAGEVLQ